MDEMQGAVALEGRTAEVIEFVRRGAGLSDISDQLFEKLRGGHKRVVDWLAKDETNLGLLLEWPIAALALAGVELSRPEQQLLASAHGKRRASRAGHGSRRGATYVRVAGGHDTSAVS